MTNRPKAPENLEFAKEWVSAAKEASESTAYNHLSTSRYQVPVELELTVRHLYRREPK